MVNKVNFNSKLGIFLIVLMMGVLAGFLTIFATNFVLFRDNTLKVEKITEKRVYLEGSATISAIATFQDSLLAVLSKKDAEGHLLTKSSIPGLCRKQAQICKETAVVLTSDGLILYGGTKQDVSVNDLLALAADGTLFELEKIKEIDGFTLYKLVVLGERVLPLDKRTKFFNLKPVMLNDLKGIELGQKVLVVNEFMGTIQKVVEGMVSERVEMDSFLVDMGKYPRMVEIGYDVSVQDGQSLFVDLGGQLVSMRSMSGTYLTGEDILAFLSRILVNRENFAPVNLGLRCVRLDKKLSEKLQLAVDYGCLVAEGVGAEYTVEPGGVTNSGVAEKLGFKSGDLILEVDNDSLLNTSLIELMQNKTHGENTQFTVLRNGKSLILKGLL